jgi:tripartite-type tricarboxylate transporter receptor subunit TctC
MRVPWATPNGTGRLLAVAGVLILALGACAPAAPPAAPTAAPAKPAEAPKPAAPVAQPAPTKPTEPAPKPTEAPDTAQAPKAAKAESKDAVAAFYSGKTIRIVVGFAAGGGYDTYARLIARHMGKHIPGNPNIVVENQAGAGSLIAANTVYKTGAKDGTVMVHFIGGQITQKYVVENPAVEFDPLDYNYVGGPTPDTPACAVRKESGFTSLEQARTKELILGGIAPGSTTNDIPNTLKAALGLNIKLVDGYDGTAKVRLAADQGEVMGGCWGWESILPTWKDGLEKGEVVVLAQGGAQPHPELKDVPMMQSLARTDDERQLIEAGITTPGLISRLFAMPPGVPAERVEAVRQAFAQSLEDPALLEEAKKAGIAISFVPHEEFPKRAKALQELSPALKQKLKAAVGG